MPRHPPNALKSLDALITIVHPGLDASLRRRPMFNLGRLNGRTTDLRKTYMCSICLPQSGQAPASHVSRQQTGCSSSQMPAFGPCKQIPSFTMSISKTPARYTSDETVLRGARRPYAGASATLFGWWSQTGSNRRPEACKATALPTELWPRPQPTSDRSAPGPTSIMVGLGRFELPTSRLSSARSNQLSYRP